MGSDPAGGDLADAQKQQVGATYDVIGALASFAAQALAASSSAKELQANLVQGLGSFLAQSAQQMMPGPLGTLLGGGIQYLFNRIQADQALPVHDDAVDVRVINFPKAGLEYSAVRDKSELRFARSQRDRYADAWSMAGTTRRAG